MKSSVFVLGFLTGNLAAYLILTQLWWPDIRLEAARGTAQAGAAVIPVPSPAAFSTPQMKTPEGLLELDPEPPPLPSATEPILGALPPETATAPAAPTEVRSLDLPLLHTDLDRLRARALRLPVQGIAPKALSDTFTDARTGHRHQAIDIMAARGTPVFAAGDGRVAKLFISKAGGLTIYQFDPEGDYCYYYAHLDAYAAGLDEGKIVGKGEVIGYVGSTGNASPDAPHLHFAIFRLGTEKRWWEGTAINAYPLWGLAERR